MGERRRARAAAMVYVMYVVTVPALLLAGVRFGMPSLLSTSVVLAALLVASALMQVVFAVSAVAARRRVPFSDRLPGEAYASVVAVPIGTTVGATAATIMPTVPRTGIGWAYVVALVVLAALSAFGIPLTCAYRLTVERGGRHLALYDETAPAAHRLYSALRRWDALVTARRWGLATVRRSWIGESDTPPVRAWPTAWTRPRALRARWLLIWAPGAAGAVAAAIEIVVIPARDWALTLLVAGVTAVAVFTLVLHAFQMALEEQTEADRLRERIATLRAELAEVAAPEPQESRGRVRRALAVLLGRD